MIEITLTEMVLFAWAVLATAAAMKFKSDAEMGRRMFIALLENKEAREQLLKAHAEFKRGQA